LTLFLKNNIWSILWGALNILLTSLPGDVFPSLPRFADLFQPDKLVHILIFLVFGFLLIRGFKMEGNPPVIRRNPVTIALTIAISIGGLTELLQGLIIPMRTSSPYDFIANSAGSILGAILFFYWQKKKRNIVK